MVIYNFVSIDLKKTTTTMDVSSKIGIKKLSMPRGNH